MRWFRRNAETIEAVAASITALVAVAALIGVKFQLDEADRLQRMQSARDAYRGHLVLAADKPAFAKPADVCTLLQSSQAGAYEAFVDHLLYSAEQMLEIDPEWSDTFSDHLGAHTSYLCSDDGPLGDTDAMISLISDFKADHCPSTPSC